MLLDVIGCHTMVYGSCVKFDKMLADWHNINQMSLSLIEWLQFTTAANQKCTEYRKNGIETSKRLKYLISSNKIKKLFIKMVLTLLDWMKICATFHSLQFLFVDCLMPLTLEPLKSSSKWAGKSKIIIIAL